MISGPFPAPSGEVVTPVPPSPVAPSSSGELPGESTLIPVRMLNEFTYCPRLGYLEWVQGEWAENLETLQGSFGHRQVDKADRKPIEPPKDDAAGDGSKEADGPIHARSIMLSSDEEGILAKLDLLELDGTQATPVD